MQSTVLFLPLAIKNLINMTVLKFFIIQSPCLVIKNGSEQLFFPHCSSLLVESGFQCLFPAISRCTTYVSWYLPSHFDIFSDYLLNFVVRLEHVNFKVLDFFSQKSSIEIRLSVLIHFLPQYNFLPMSFILFWYMSIDVKDTY